MQERKFDELESRASVSEGLDSIRQLEARTRVAKEIELMKAEGKALELSDEEAEMLHSFRRFKLRMCKTHDTFKWYTAKPEGVQLAAETCLIVHPQEVQSRD